MPRGRPKKSVIGAKAESVEIIEDGRVKAPKKELDMVKAKKKAQKIMDVVDVSQKVNKVKQKGNMYERYIQKNLDWIQDLYRNGAKDRQICELFNIGYTTYMNYLEDYPELAEVQRLGKEVTDAKVENALFNKIVGVKIKKQVAVKLTDRNYDDEGKLISTVERIEVVTLEEEIPPDGNLALKWLEVKRKNVWDRTPKTETAESKIDNLFNEIRNQIDIKEAEAEKMIEVIYGERD